MFIKSVSTALALVLVTGAAHAQSAGSEQLARFAGVDAALYTDAQLIQLIDAQRDNDTNRINYILGMARADASRAVAFDGAASSPANAQLEAILGVEPGRFSAAELIELNEAMRDNDTNRVNFILSGANRTTPATGGSVNPGKAQLAAQLGVDAADYTTAQLIDMLPRNDD